MAQHGDLAHSRTFGVSLKPLVSCRQLSAQCTTQCAPHLAVTAEDEAGRGVSFEPDAGAEPPKLKSGKAYLGQNRRALQLRPNPMRLLSMLMCSSVAC